MPPVMAGLCYSAACMWRASSSRSLQTSEQTRGLCTDVVWSCHACLLLCYGEPCCQALFPLQLVCAGQCKQLIVNTPMLGGGGKQLLCALYGMLGQCCTVPYRWLSKAELLGSGCRCCAGACNYKQMILSILLLPGSTANNECTGISGVYHKGCAQVLTSRSIKVNILLFAALAALLHIRCTAPGGLHELFVLLVLVFLDALRAPAISGI